MWKHVAIAQATLAVLAFGASGLGMSGFVGNRKLAKQWDGAARRLALGAILGIAIFSVSVLTVALLD